MSNFIKNNSLISGKFSNIFKDETKNKSLILIILIEDLSNNSPIHNLDYYFYGFDKNNNNDYNLLENQENTLNLINKDAILEIKYPINKTYIKKNGEELSDTFKKIDAYFSGHQ